MKNGLKDIIDIGHPEMPEIGAFEVLSIIERFNLGDLLQEDDSQSLNYTITQTHPEKTKIQIEDIIRVDLVESQEVLHKLSLDGLDLQSCDLSNIYQTVLPSREATYGTPKYLNDFGQYAKDFISKYPKLYKHQAQALDMLHQGGDVCLATSTASGKSEVFFAHALSIISKDPNAKILVLYPMKALNRQQFERWQTAFTSANVPLEKLAKIDGGVPVSSRPDLIKNASIIIATPDVVQAWLMRIDNSTDRIKSFLRNLKLVILDEAHLYNGVFGTNTAYLLRRLNVAAFVLNKTIPQYLVASGTLDEPMEHLQKLTTRNFEILGEESDGSPEYQKTIIFVRPNKDLFTSFSHLLNQLIELRHQSITFSNSRKMAGSIARAVNSSTANNEPISAIDLENNTQDSDHIASTENNLISQYKERIRVYRAGLSDQELQEIQIGLTNGTISAVVATSALEVGIDIPDLSVCVLAGVPNDGASLKQRLGRIGRKREGLVIVMDDKLDLSRKVFKKPSLLFSLPYPKSCLYLENSNVMKAHALCLQDEMSKLNNSGLLDKDNYEMLPDKFINVYNEMLQSGDDNDGWGDIQSIHVKFNLRDAEPQWQLLSVGLPHNEQHPHPVGTITQSQMMREAYPGAIYLHGGRAFRVFKVVKTATERNILLITERGGRTSVPVTLPNIVRIDEIPRMWQNIAKFGQVVTFLTPSFPQQFVKGVKYSGQSDSTSYPVSRNDNKGFIYSSSLIGRKIKTTGFVLTHSILNSKDVDSEKIADLILKAYVDQHAIAKADMASAAGKFRTDGELYKSGDHFLCIYDNLERGLNLCVDLSNQDVLMKALNEALEELKYLRSTSIDDLVGPNEETLNALETILSEVQSTELTSSVTEPQQYYVMSGHAKLKSTGLEVRIGNFEFKDGELYYQIFQHSGSRKLVSEDALEPIEGKTFMDICTSNDDNEFQD